MKESPESRITALEARCHHLECDVSTLTGYAWAQAAALVTLAGELSPAAREKAFEISLEPVLANALRTPIADERHPFVQQAIQEVATNFRRALAVGAETSR
jgi:hypothetical protein